MKSLCYGKILSRKACVGIFLLPFCCIPHLAASCFILLCLWWFNIWHADSACTACAAGEGRCGGLLGCFWRATLCSFDLKCGWSLSFLDSIMMCVVLFSPFLSALQTENARQSQELSLTLCCSRCDLFRIAVKISECVRFGQNVGFGRWHVKWL